MRTALRTAIALAMLASLGTARAEPQFRFWSLWTAPDGIWRQAQGNPDVLDVPARSVLAWVFVRSSGDVKATKAPETVARYDELCPQETGGRGTPVAVVIDYGSTSDAPVGETPPSDRVACVAVSGPVTPSSALAAAAEIRAGEEGLICGIDGYPSTECAALAVTTADPVESSDPPQNDSPPAWVYSLALLVLVAGGYGLSLWRRR